MPTIEIVPLRRARIERSSSGPGRTVDAAAPVRYPSSGLALHILLTGAASGDDAGRPIQLGPGSVHLVGVGRPPRFVGRTETSSLVLVVERAQLSAASTSTLRSAPFEDLGDDAVARGIASILRAVAQHAPEPGSSAAAELESVLLGQLEALLLGAHVRRAAGAELAGSVYGAVRERVLSAPESTLAQWADEFGTTAEVVRVALAAQGWTLRTLLTEVRLIRLAEILSGPELHDPLAVTVALLGFTDARQAGRAFQRRYGITMRRYRLLTRN